MAIALPWYIYVIVESRGDFFWHFIIYHNVERALGTSEGLKPGRSGSTFPG